MLFCPSGRGSGWRTAIEVQSLSRRSDCGPHRIDFGEPPHPGVPPDIPGERAGERRRGAPRHPHRSLRPRWGHPVLRHHRWGKKLYSWGHVGIWVLNFEFPCNLRKFTKLELIF